MSVFSASVFIGPVVSFAKYAQERDVDLPCRPLLTYIMLFMYRLVQSSVDSPS